jgi:hypothetical protein
VKMSSRWIVAADHISGTVGGAWGGDTFEVHNSTWNPASSQNGNYGTIAAGHGYYYNGLQSGGPGGSEAADGELYVAGKSMLIGSVGIGTVSPSYKLHVAGDVRSDNVYTDTINSITAGDPLELNYRGTAPTIICATVNCGTISAYFGTSGNVGIGTNSPGTKLDVNGNIKVTPTSASWAEGIQFSMPTTAQWGGLRWSRNRANYDGNWAIGYQGLDSTDDLVFTAQNGANRVDNILRLTKTGNASIAGTLQINGASNSSAYAMQFSRSGGGASPDIWGASGGLTLGGTGSDSAQLVLKSGGNVGIGTSDPQHKLDVSGNARVTGYVTTSSVTASGNDAFGGIINGTNSNTTNLSAGVYGQGGLYGVIGESGTSGGFAIYCKANGSALCGGYKAWTNQSDKRLKQEITTIENALGKVTKLRGVNFEFKTDPGVKHIGFIAQELLNVVPEVVSKGPDGYYSVTESSINAVLVEAVKELKAENDDLKSRIEKLEAKLK